MIAIDVQLLRRIRASMNWLVTDSKLRFDDCRGNLEEGSAGGYSPELTEAIDVLHELEAFTK